MDEINPLPIGAQHYVLMLIPRLIRDIEELGLPHIIRTSSFTEREVTTLYFEFVSINRVLPSEPEHIAPGLWPHLIYCVQVMTEMVNSASMEELAQAREQAIRKFLPHARQTVEKEYQDQCREGAVDLHLAGVLRHDSSPDHSRELCMEAIRLEREQRIESVRGLSTAHLDAHSACIVEAAKTYVEQAQADASGDFGLLDLVVRLLDLLRLVHVLETSPSAQAAIPADFSVDNIVLGIGNALYRKELGLRFTQVKAPRP